MTVAVNISSKFRVSCVFRWVCCDGDRPYVCQHFPHIQVLQQHLLGVDQLLWRERAADVLKGFLFGRAAKLDVRLERCPRTKDTAQTFWSLDAHHLKKKTQLDNRLFTKI